MSGFSPYPTDDVTSSFSDVTYLNTSADPLKCVIDGEKIFGIIFIPFKILIFLFNLILLSAAILDRKKLQRQSYVFYCVTSTLVCILLNMLCSIFWTIDNFFYSDVSSQKGIMTKQKYFWVTTQAVTVAMLYAITANVTTLIYVTLESAHYVGRTGTEWGGTSDKKSSFSSKKRKAQVLLAISWIVPLGFIAVFLGWNCAEECECPSDNYVETYCPENSCSRLFAPLKLTTILAIICLWALQGIFLFVAVISGIRKHKQSIDPAKKATSPKQAGSNSDITKGNDSNRDSIKSAELPGLTSFPGNGERKSITVTRKNSKLKFAINLSLVILICSVVDVLMNVIDATYKEAIVSGLRGVTSTTMIVYSIACPILIWKFIPSLKLSLILLFSKIRSCSCVKKSRDRKKKTGEKSES